MKIEIIGIIVSVITAISIAIYQVKSSRQKTVDKRRSTSHQDIWNALNDMRVYYEQGMQTELQTIGTLKLEPVFSFREIINKSKLNIESDLYVDLTELYEKLSKETNNNLFKPMKIFLNKKNELFPNELKEINVNKSRILILKDIESFMEKNKKILN